MCRCIHHWERDESAEPPHDLVPVTCEQVIQGLQGRPDNIPWETVTKRLVALKERMNDDPEG